jgi:tripartite-type tricarboxylate transporter receptor subunit TctC
MQYMLIRNGALIAAACGLVASGPSWSHSYPVKPVRLIVAGPAGGGNDVITRPIAQKLSESMGQQFIVDNRAGAGTLVAGQATTGAAPDGYTVLMGTISTLCISPYLVKKKPYDPVEDFTPITLVATAGLMVTVNPALPVRTIGELIGLAKSRPGQLTYASNGAGSLSHLTTELFSRAAGIRMVHVPYKGGAPAAMDTIGGQTQLVITAIPTLIAHVKSARLRAIAVTSIRRSPALPDLPTVAESGLPGFESSQWFAAFAPKNTPASIVERLYRELGKAVDIAAVRAALSQEGAELTVTGPQSLGKLVQGDSAKWQKIIRESRIVLE